MKKTIILLFCLLIAVSFFSLPIAVAGFVALGIALLVYVVMPGTTKEPQTQRRVLFGILCGNILLFVYTRFQNFIPFWDYVGYYIETLRGSDLMQDNLFGFFEALYKTMLESDYTKLPTLFTAPLIRLFGGSYRAYIMLNYNLFVVPFFILLSRLVPRIWRGGVWLIFLFPPFVNPVLRGYLDAVGLLYVIVWLYTVYEDDFSVLRVKRDIALGLLTLLLVFTRRWYLFFVVGTFLALLLTGIIRKLYDKKYKLLPLFYNLLLIGGTTFLLVLVFFFPYVRRLLTNTMQDAYSAYQFGSFWWNIKYYIKYYGVILCMFTALGLFGLRRERFRPFVIFLVLHLVSMFFLFTRIQTVSYHHQYIFATDMFLLMIIGVASVPKCQRLVARLLSITLVIACLYTWIPTSTNFLYGALTTVRFAPKRMNREGIDTLRDKLNALVDAEGGQVYILSSSEQLNDDILQRSLLPDSYEALHNCITTAHVDKRDGFPNYMLVAKFIVVATPVQVHLTEPNQQVVAYFVREILDGTHTPNLTRIDSVNISNGVTAHIYRRTGGYTLDFLDRAKKHFETLYPDHPNLTNVDYVWSQN